MTTGSTPTARRRELAKLFRDLRRQRGLPLEQVATGIKSSVSKVSRLEAGLRSISVDDVRRLGEFYSLSTAELSRLVQIAEEGLRRSWWDSRTQSQAMRTYIGVEQVATMIAAFTCNIIPGLLQTESYARALASGTGINEEQSEADIVTLRLRRQQLLERDDPPWVQAVLDESALHRAVGSNATMREQLQWLLTVGERPRVSIRIIPLSAGAHPGLDNQFFMLHVAEEQKLELVHVDGIHGSVNFEKPNELGRYVRAWNELTSIALTPSDSADRIGRISTGMLGQA
jgi:transcriptional regulator with XRE-family HTH domain